MKSGDNDISKFDGNTFLLKVSEECGKQKCVYIGGSMVCSFLTDDKIYKYISNMEDIILPESKVIGEINVYFHNPHFKSLKKDMIDGNDICLDTFDDYVLKYKKRFLK